jgi:hypothetical protein
LDFDRSKGIESCMLSERTQAQIEYLSPSRKRRSDHQYTIEVIVTLIQQGEIRHSGQVRDVCERLGWSPKPTEELCGMVDDVGLALLTVGIIEQR